MKKKPDILVVLAVILGLGITLSSVGNNGESGTEPLQTTQQEALNNNGEKVVARNR